MRNKNLVIGLSFIIIIAAITLTAMLPEQKFFHLGYEIIILAVVLLSMYLPVKDVIIIILVSSCVVWSMGFFEFISQLQQLIVETCVIIAASCAIGWYESNYNLEKKQNDTIVAYKNGEMNELTRKIAGLNKENHEILEETKRIRQIFVP
jgi:hypothetical protein